MTRRLLSLAILAIPFAAALAARADEGMWTFNHFPKQIVEQHYGFAPSDAWLDHVRLSSLRFNNGGSGAFVSPEGLVMTNHHVGSDCIHELGSAMHDYMAEGFYAPTREQEAKCPDLELNVLVGIEDVTSAVNAQTRPEMNPAARSAAQRAAMARLEKECNERTGQRCDVITLYEGGVFNLYRYKKYTDVRLVFAPEADIAFYGGDPDNFTYPRYDLDVAFFHIYENGQPLRVEHYLVWNPQGVGEGNLVFVSGNPGSTSRQKTMAQLEFARDVQFPETLRMLRARLALLRNFSTRGKEEARIARDTIFFYENSVKGVAGLEAGLQDPTFLARRALVEKELRARVGADPKMQKEFGGAWDAIARAEKKFSEFYRTYRLFSWALRQSTLYVHARDLVRLPVERAKPNDQRLVEYRDSSLESLKQSLFSEAPVYDATETIMLAQAFAEMSDALGPGDALVKQVLAGRTPTEAAAAHVKGSKLQSVGERKRLFDGGQKAVDDSTDAMLALARLVDARARQFRKRYEDEVQAIERANGTLLARALFALRGTEVYPEATFTLRLSFGAVKGYTDEGRPRRWYTTFCGLYENSADVPPYKLPQRWLDKKSALNLDTPFNFVSTPDITGGNSGSPVINRNAELVGIVFDGNLQQIPNDFLYRDEQARTVAVHAAAIIEALRKVYAADAVLRELHVAGAR
ncbi:MAG TPA: S46 family peptidase [Candidatus Acidoferrales bacterium]|nr:S46 family peptidase [Candidatus Acidoferrales bacterium]